MEAIRKHASKLKEQVFLRQFTSRFGNDSIVSDEVELSCHQKLQMLYGSTRTTKHFQRDIVRSIENFISVSSKQIDIVKKFAEDCCTYGNAYKDSDLCLAEASIDFGNSHKLMEKEKETLLRVLGEQLSEPLCIMIMGAPLEDARRLTYRYERLRKDVEAQLKFQSARMKCEDVNASMDSAMRLQQAVTKLSEMNTTLSALGIEATSAMESVEAQQQLITFQKLCEMVEAERSYHRKVIDVLDKLHAQMLQVQQHTESPVESGTLVASELSHSSQNNSTESLRLPRITTTMGHPLPTDKSKLKSSDDNKQEQIQFLAEVIHPFDAQADGELSLAIGDYVIVGQMTPDGWSQGECKGKSGWFPSAYVEQRDEAPPNNNQPLDEEKPEL